MSRSVNRLAALMLSALLFAVSCGDSDDAGEDGAADTSEATTTTEAATTTAAEPVGETVPVELKEWEVNTVSELAAGTVTFEITNTGEFNHEFVVILGESYDSFPMLDNGAVDEEMLGADVIGRSDLIDAGQSTTATFDLEPGNYVFLCNVNFGPNSHAAQGQVLSVTVTG